MTMKEKCAACRHRRKKCGPNCIFRPYFPFETHHRKFENAHKLFGVNNMTRIIQNLNDQQERDEAMRSIIYEADARARDPVGGCSRIIRQLNAEIAISTALLASVRQQIAIGRTLDMQQQNFHLHLQYDNNNNNAQLVQNQIGNNNDDDHLIIDFQHLDYDLRV